MPSSFSVGNNLMFKCYEEVKGCQDPIKHFVNIDIELIEPYGSLQITEGFGAAVLKGGISDRKVN